MDTLVNDRRRSGARVLFEDDFDLPPRMPKVQEPPEPEVIEPVFSASDLTTARAEGWHEGHDQAETEAQATCATVTRDAVWSIAAQLAEGKAEARMIADAAADAIAHLLIAGFAAAFPALCRRYGEAEICALVRTMLPALQSEPKITVRASADAVPAVTQALETVDPELTAQVEIVAAAGLGPGDVRVAWRAGNAVRDTKRLWQDIEAILAPAGLLPPQPVNKETADVD